MKLDKKLLSEIQEQWIKKIKVFFYEAGCSGKKVNIEFDDFEIGDLIPLPSPPLPGEGTEDSSSQDRGDLGGSCKIYVPKEDREHFENCRITRIQKADHTWVVKSRYIYTSDEVQDRCGCGTSFAFEKKKPTIDFSKLKDLKTRFN